MTTTWWVALFRKGAELTGGSYARVPITEWMQRNGDRVSNTKRLDFPVATSDWGDVDGAGLYDASEGGNLLCDTRLNKTRNVLTGDVACFDADEFWIDGSILEKA